MPPQFSDPQLGLCADGPLPACLRASPVQPGPCCLELGRVGRAEIPSVGVFDRDGDGLVAAAADHEPRRINPYRPQARVRQSEHVVVHVVPPPQDEQSSARRLQALHALSEWGKRNSQGLVIVAGQPEGASPQTYVEPASARGLDHRKLRGEQERVAQADVHHPNGERDVPGPCRHGAQQGWGVPRRGRSRGGGDVIEASE
jgi:hypothetical protein